MILNCKYKLSTNIMGGIGQQHISCARQVSRQFNGKMHRARISFFSFSLFCCTLESMFSRCTAAAAYMSVANRFQVQFQCTYLLGLACHTFCEIMMLELGFLLFLQHCWDIQWQLLENMKSKSCVVILLFIDFNWLSDSKLSSCNCNNLEIVSVLLDGWHDLRDW